MAMRYLKDFVEKKAEERAWWIEHTIMDALPNWKSKLLKKYSYLWLAWILNVNVEIIYEDLIKDLGSRVIIKLNDKIIGDKEFIL